MKARSPSLSEDASSPGMSLPISDIVDHRDESDVRNHPGKWNDGDDVGMGKKCSDPVFLSGR